VHDFIELHPLLQLLIFIYTVKFTSDLKGVYVAFEKNEMDVACSMYGGKDGCI
jgi:hypothetical protein